MLFNTKIDFMDPFLPYLNVKYQLVLPLFMIKQVDIRHVDMVKMGDDFYFLFTTIKNICEYTGRPSKRRAAFSAKTPAADGLIGKNANRGHGNT